MDKEMIGMCGTYCGDCDWRGKQTVQVAKRQVVRCFGENVQWQSVQLQKASNTAAIVQSYRVKNYRTLSTTQNMETMENVTSIYKHGQREKKHTLEFEQLTKKILKTVKSVPKYYIKFCAYALFVGLRLTRHLQH